MFTTHTNHIRQHIPNFVSGLVSGLVSAEGSFTTKEELLEIKFVKDWSDQEGFTCYAISKNRPDQPLLMAMLNNCRQWWVIGYLKTTEGLDLPYWEDIHVGEKMMKVWILKARDEELPDNDNPWEPWFDKNFGLVVRAETETRARQLAQAEATDETYVDYTGRRLTPWLDAKYSTCVELTNEGDEGVLLIDHRSA